MKKNLNNGPIEGKDKVQMAPGHSDSMTRDIEELYYLKEEIESRQGHMNMLESLRGKNEKLADRAGAMSAKDKE